MIRIGSRSFATADELEKLIVHCATEYEVSGYVEDFAGVEVSDPEYDDLLRALKQLKPGSVAFRGTSPSTATPAGVTVRLDPPMTSIDKADGTDDEKLAIYRRWLADCEKRLGKSPVSVCQSLKRDGVAGRFTYEDGVLTSAALRPRDGVLGTDITRHVPHLRGVPLKLRLPLTLSLNGEIECWFADFDAVNQARDEAGEDPYKNPRNYTAGCLGRDDPAENTHARLRVTFHSITGFADWADYYQTEVERARWANSKAGLALQDEDGNGLFVQVRPHRFDDLGGLELSCKTLPYYVDGIVLKVDDIADQEELGHHGDDPVKPPRGALAWKFREEEAEAIVKELEWNASRTGRIVPTAVFARAVNLADTDVTRATCNNYGWASNLKIGPGTVVKVKKAGKIIPNVCGVVRDQVKSFRSPGQCPACGSNLVVYTSPSGNQDLLCNSSDCAAKHVHAWVFFLAKTGAKGLGTSAMEKILAGGRVRTLTDLFELSVPDLQDVGFSERQASLALATIYGLPPDKDNDRLLRAVEKARASRRQIEGWRFFASLGIPGAGETVGKALFAHYRDWSKVRNATEQDLLGVTGIGPVTARAVADWFVVNGLMVDDLLDRFELELPKSGNLDGKNFCLTGSFTLGKKHWQTEIESRGGNVQSSVGKTTSYLIQEHGKSDGSPSEKEAKAAKYGVQVISVVELQKLF